MSDHIDRAEIAIHNAIFATGGENARTSPGKAARALDAADLLVTPAHDAQVAAKALREAAERIRAVVENPRWESERFTEHVLIEAGVERLLNDYADLIGPIEREGGDR